MQGFDFDDMLQMGEDWVQDGGSVTPVVVPDLSNCVTPDSPPTQIVLPTQFDEDIEVDAAEDRNESVAEPVAAMTLFETPPKRRRLRTKSSPTDAWKMLSNLLWQTMSREEVSNLAYMSIVVCVQNECSHVRLRV